MMVPVPALVATARLKRQIRFAKMRRGVRGRGASLDAFKEVPMPRKIVPFGFRDMRTDGVGNVLEMPLMVPDCFGDIVTLIRWKRLLPIRTITSNKGRWSSKVEIHSRCTTCKAAQGCISLGRERIASETIVSRAYELWQLIESKPGRPAYATLWLKFVETVADFWSWETMEVERAAFMAERATAKQEERKVAETLRKRNKRANARGTPVDPLTMGDPALLLERTTRERALRTLIQTSPAPPRWRPMTADSAERISWVWYARQLLIRAGAGSPSAGRVAKVYASVVPFTELNEALRSRMGADFKHIEALETPPGIWS
jgi:hypothetical protein